MEVTLRKSLVSEITKKKNNKTLISWSQNISSRHVIVVLLLVVLRNVIKSSVQLSVHLQTYIFFYFLIVNLPYTIV